MFRTQIKPGRLAMMITIVLVFADLFPHPALPPGIIATVMSEMQPVAVERTH